MMELMKAAKFIQEFEKGSLSQRISQLEKAGKQKTREDFDAMLSAAAVRPDILEAALTFKRLAGQINVIIHAVGILLSLPYILEQNEVVEVLSLGAGSTGKNFDLETDKQVAEFKFINWREKRNTIRQNQLFKDFFNLAEHETTKRKCLYVLGTEMPLKFLQGGRALNSVLSRNKKIDTLLHQYHGNQYARVDEYYVVNREKVELIDLLEILPEEIRQIFEITNP